MIEKTFSEVKNESIDFGDVQFWIAMCKPFNKKEVISTYCGYFNNINSDIYRIIWDKWVYFGPLELEDLVNQ